MPFVCPDGAVVAYAWKRQLAGQVGASAIDRTRLALKAFTDQKRRFFPHLDDASNDQCNESTSKKQRISQAPAAHNQEDGLDCKTLLEVLVRMEKFPYTYERLDWLKRASSLPENESSSETLKDHSYHSSSKLRSSPPDVAPDKAAVIGLLFPSTFRAVVSLHPAGSIDPDATSAIRTNQL
ncbi:hypothetical protein DVH24_019889 [Malus domestica]|uniref:Uncharacterized protein n=1 Tax=Malus domestica TaxID=3750 RepID=A0A498I677_MALDO|nr:hypothetical protein DVH24_019889 [Malus domestica]